MYYDTHTFVTSGPTKLSVTVIGGLMLCYTTSRHIIQILKIYLFVMNVIVFIIHINFHTYMKVFMKVDVYAWKFIKKKISGCADF